MEAWFTTLKLVVDDLVRMLLEVEAVAAVEIELPTRLSFLVVGIEARSCNGGKDAREAWTSSEGL